MNLKISDETTICVTADICNAVFPEHKDIRRWDNIICAGIRLEETIRHLKDDYGNSPRMTWFVRADPWMRRRFRSSTFLFERHRAHLSLLATRGHEIAWHPHLDVGNLSREISELPEIVEQVRDIFPVTSVRSGEGFHSNELIRLFEELGFTADSTALPGRSNDKCRTPFDWANTCESPYYPDMNDYRLSDKSCSSNLLEIPFTMLPIRLSGDKPGPSARYMNFSYYPEQFQMGVLTKKQWPSVIVGIIHPAEICPPRGYEKKHRLLSFDEAAPFKNLSILIDRLRSSGRKVRYMTVHDAELKIRESRFHPEIFMTYEKSMSGERVN